MDDTNMLMYIIIAVIVLVIIKSRMIERFYSYYPPSNCMDSLLGGIVCFPPYYFPFYRGYGWY